MKQENQSASRSPTGLTPNKVADFRENHNDQKIREAIYLIFNEFDTQRTGHLNFGQFSKFHNVEDSEEIFQLLDKDSNGLLDINAMYEFIETIRVREEERGDQGSLLSAIN